MVVYSFRCARCRTEKAVFDVTEAHAMIANGYICDKCKAAMASEPQTGGQVVGGGSPVPDEAATAGGTGTTDRAMLGWLSPAERQSGYDRLMHATGLILQLPRDHDGRNTWLMNYAKDKDPVVQASIRNNPAEFTAKHASMQRGTELDNCLPLSDRTTSMIRYIKAKIEQGYAPYYTKQPEVLTPDALLFEFENASAWAGDD